MSRLKQIAAATLAMCAAVENDCFYYDKPVTRRMRFNPDYKVTPPNRVLREFTVNGNKVMAYSKKDAIKRMKHKIS